MEQFVDYADGSVVSKTLLKKDIGNITLFAFDKGQGLSEHTAPFYAVRGLKFESDADIGEKDSFRSGTSYAIYVIRGYYP